MHHRPFVLHIFRRNHQPCLIGTVLAAAGFGVVPATTSTEAMNHSLRVDAILICSCWATEDKHALLDTLRTRREVPVICVNDFPHDCAACAEADPFRPEALVAIIREKIACGKKPNRTVGPSSSCSGRAT